MQILIVNYNWYHSEILGSLLLYLNYRNDINIKFIFDPSKKEGNYISYFLKLNKNIKYEIIKYKSPKYLVEYFLNCDYLFCLEEIQLKKIMTKNIFRQNSNKIISYYHTNCGKFFFPDIKKIILGEVPFNSKFKNKYLIPNYFIDNKFKFDNQKNKKIYLIIGKISLEHKCLNLLKNLEKYNCLIYIISRNPCDIQESKNIKILKNISCNELIELYKKTDFIMTLNQPNCIYHKTMITGIISFAISYGIPLIIDKMFNKLNKFNFLDDELIYDSEFNNAFEYSVKMNKKQWLKNHDKIIDYRDKQILANNLKFINLII